LRSWAHLLALLHNDAHLVAPAVPGDMVLMVVLVMALALVLAAARLVA